MADTAHKVTRREAKVDAQVVQPREPDSAEVDVNEVYVTTDVVITDPSAENAVQVPDEGRGSLDLPIHRLDGETANEALADVKPDKKKS